MNFRSRDYNLGYGDAVHRRGFNTGAHSSLYRKGYEAGQKELRVNRMIFSGFTVAGFVSVIAILALQGIGIAS